MIIVNVISQQVVITVISSSLSVCSQTTACNGRIFDVIDHAFSCIVAFWRCCLALFGKEYDKIFSRRYSAVVLVDSLSGEMLNNFVCFVALDCWR